MTQDQRSTRESFRTSSINIQSPKNIAAINRSQNLFFANRLSTQTPKIRDYIQITDRRKLTEITSKNQALLSIIDSKYASEVKKGQRTQNISKRYSCIHAASDVFKGQISIIWKTDVENGKKIETRKTHLKSDHRKYWIYLKETGQFKLIV